METRHTVALARRLRRPSRPARARPQADMSPTLPPTGWPISATSGSYPAQTDQILHIPKAGGTSVEHEDAHAPSFTRPRCGRTPSCRTTAPSSANLRDRRMWLGFDTCRRRQFHAFAPFSPHHMTPHDLCVLGMCGLFNWYSGADTVYSGTDAVYRGADAVYCVMRDPLRRLASDVEYVRSTPGLWPLDNKAWSRTRPPPSDSRPLSRAWPPACGCATPDCGITKIEDCPVSLRCYLKRYPRPPVDRRPADGGAHRGARGHRQPYAPVVLARAQQDARLQRVLCTCAAAESNDPRPRTGRPA